MRSAVRAALVCFVLASAGQPARAVEPLYEGQMLRLAEILGSLHFLRTLCGEEEAVWRGQMETLLTAENPPPERRERLIASFNHGYRSFGGIYQTCTVSATASISRYMQEGEKLSRDIAVRFGN